MLKVYRQIANTKWFDVAVASPRSRRSLGGELFHHV
jgi:hypothetical protein